VSAWLERAEVSWRELARVSSSRGLRAQRIHEPGSRRPVGLWPLTQMLRAAVLLDWAGGYLGDLDARALWKALGRYRRGPGYGDTPVTGGRHYDDNALIGLTAATRAVAHPDPALAQTWWRRAEDEMRYVAHGLTPTGGFRWDRNSMEEQAGATGAAGALAASLEGAPRGAGDRWRSVAEAATGFLSRDLVLPSGLIAEYRVGDTLSHVIHAHNQGYAIRLLVWRGDTGAALELAGRAMNYFNPLRLWRSPAAYSAIMCRALLTLDAVAPEPTGIPEYVEAYLEALWTRGRDDAGLFTRMGQYGHGSVLDHSAVVALMSAAALPERSRALMW